MCRCVLGRVLGSEEGLGRFERVRVRVASCASCEVADASLRQGRTQLPSKRKWVPLKGPLVVVAFRRATNKVPR